MRDAYPKLTLQLAEEKTENILSMLRQGELDALPIADSELDACVAGMVLHHLEELARPLAEMLRARSALAEQKHYDFIPAKAESVIHIFSALAGMKS